MCGIAGLLVDKAASPAGAHEIRAVIARMTGTLSLRGPDNVGHYIDLPIALGHRRLSILDLSDAGAQPMSLGPSLPVITYNGECYNFRELRKELENKGCLFRSGSDTEVVLQAYAHWGLCGLRRLEGIFGLAIWDPQRDRLVLMRDRFGVKPLYYGQSQHGLAFGSEIKAVLAAGGVDISLNDQTLSEYLWYGNAYEDRTFYNGIRVLEPGNWLIVERGHKRIEQWWRIEEWLDRRSEILLPSAAADRVRIAIDEAVRRQLIADVPVGLFLSGGVDSSAIAAAAVQARSNSPISYAAGFDIEGSVNELPKAAKVARHLGLRHRELNVRATDLPDALLALSRAHDEPFGDAANIPLYLMCKALQGEVKVVLQGDGGDEIFAGYRRYTLIRNADLWSLWPRLFLPLVRDRGNWRRRFARVADAVCHADPAMRMALLLTSETHSSPPEQFFTDERRCHLAENTDPFLAYRRAAERFADQDPVQRMLLTDLTVQLPSTFLTKVDRATMAAGVEARVPLLDERVAELAVGMPTGFKVGRREKKIVLRHSQRGRLPEEILNGPKTGFGVPFGHWMRTSLSEFARERLLDQRFLKAFDLDFGVVEGRLKANLAGNGSHDYTLWKLLQLALWQDNRLEI